MSLCEGVVSYVEGKFHLFMVSPPYQAPTANWPSYQDGLRQSYLENTYGADLFLKDTNIYLSNLGFPNQMWNRDQIQHGGLKEI